MTDDEFLKHLKEKYAKAESMPVNMSQFLQHVEITVTTYAALREQTLSNTKTIAQTTLLALVLSACAILIATFK